MSKRSQTPVKKMNEGNGKIKKVHQYERHLKSVMTWKTLRAVHHQ